MVQSLDVDLMAEHKGEMASLRNASTNQLAADIAVMAISDPIAAGPWTGFCNGTTPFWLRRLSLTICTSAALGSLT